MLGVQHLKAQASRSPSQIAVENAEAKIDMTTAQAVDPFGGGEMNAVVSAQSISRAEFASPADQRLVNFYNLPFMPVTIQLMQQTPEYRFVCARLGEPREGGTGFHVREHLRRNDAGRGHGGAHFFGMGFRHK